jgi:hypothetical protein
MTRPNQDERFVIEGDPEDALRGLLRAEPLTGEDQVLMRSWTLWLADPTEAGDSEQQALLPKLLAAGYAETEGDTWGFTPKGIARAEELDPDD